MFVSEFDYDLPAELIAQTPVEPRDHSRLMVIYRDSREVYERYFYEIGDYLNAGDLLVFNDTRVIPARLRARKEHPGGADIEVFLLKEHGPSRWECLVRPGKRARAGTRLIFEHGMSAEVLEVKEDGNRIIQFDPGMDFHAWLLQNGETPLPPYITSPLDRPERYQTVYSKHEGSVAAPTAGLHFTPELLERLKAKGVRTGFLTLHVGLGTFRPVQVDRVEEHRMHSEWFMLSEELVEAVRETKAKGSRVIAVGTTSVRVLESQASPDGQLKPGTGETSIFIYPGYQFKVIDGLITNFHLPKSSLLMLVSAFAGKDFIMEQYRRAIASGFRFFSFGDAMLIL